MNPQILRNIGCFLLGGAVGAVAGKMAFEHKLRAEYEESQQSLIRALERNQTTFTQYVEAPRLLEDDLVDAANTVRDRVLAENEAALAALNEEEASEVPPVPEYINHYQRALDNASSVEVQDTSAELFIAGGVNDYGVSYIEEDDYDEDDGRFKGQITMVMGHNGNPDFFMDGSQIQDWAERVGDSIIVDFYQHVPPNAPPILYVRNHKRDEDYEVTRETP